MEIVTSVPEIVHLQVAQGQLRDFVGKESFAEDVVTSMSYTSSFVHKQRR